MWSPVLLTGPLGRLTTCVRNGIRTIGTENPRSVDDLFHASVNGRGEFLNAADPAELVASLKAIKDLIEENEGTASSVSINANKIEANTLLFQTSYDSGDWSGDIEAKCLDSRGNVAPCDGVSCEASCNENFETCLEPLLDWRYRL